MNAPLSFIDDATLSDLIIKVLNTVTVDETSAEMDMYKNVIDPFSAVFDAGRQKITIGDWLEQEKTRQLQKSLQNAIGAFHQNVLGSIPGWDNLGIGQNFDLKNDEMKIIAEVKNKYNTMNSKAQAEAYKGLDNAIRYRYQGYVAYCVFIIPRGAQRTDKIFAPNDNGRKLAEVEDIRQMDGYSFYDMATGEKDTLQRLYERVGYLMPQLVPGLGDTLSREIYFEDIFSRAFFPAR